MKSKAGVVEFGKVSGLCTVFPRGGGALNGDLVVGTTDLINSAMRERLVGHPNKLALTGYLAYEL